jgi:ATP-dependent DNA helicase Rep/DNA helicase-2/ATP-dependent DNA helicase PcrA
LRHADEVADLPPPARAGVRSFTATMAPAVERARSLRPLELGCFARDLFERFALRNAILEADDAPGLAARRLENFDEVLASLDRYATSAPAGEGALAEYLRRAALVRSPEEDAKAGSGQVTLMTLHSAKGLEFLYVLMVGIEEELLPHKRTLELGGDLAEERRLCYVGMTRARRQLWLTYARERLRQGKLVERTPSRFLDEIPAGAGVCRVGRDDAGFDEERADELAGEFFKKMRAQLGIED